MLNESRQKSDPAVGSAFIEMLARQDFEQLERLFAPQVRFRALLPPRICEENTAAAATEWLRRWFGGADHLQVLQKTADQVFDRLHLCYRLRTYDAVNGWRAIEQQAYYVVQQEGQIADMWLLCSGFRPDPQKEIIPKDASQELPFCALPQSV